MKGEHSVILSTFIKLSFVIKIFVLSIFEWPLKTGFTVYAKNPLNTHVDLSSRAVYLYFSPNHHPNPYFVSKEGSVESAHFEEAHQLKLLCLTL